MCVILHLKGLKDFLSLLQITDSWQLDGNATQRERKTSDSSVIICEQEQ